jgi:hypothetical protein
VKRWDRKNQCHVERQDVDLFLAEVEQVCVRFGFCIGHEDEHGGFEILPFSKDTMDWLKDAAVIADPPRWAVKE